MTGADVWGELPPEDFGGPPPRDLGLLDWSEFWQRERTEVEYMIPGILPGGSAASIYSAAGGGKSLLALEWAVCKALGLPIMGEPVEPGHVLYIDHEMDRDLLEDRLTALGVDEDTDLSRLHYSLLGDWPPLDTPEGGWALLEAAQAVGAVLVVVDTISRAIEGEENPADTWLRLYRFTVRRLKLAGISFLRLDHSGKDATKNERGSSAKRSDVDQVHRIEVVGADRVNLVRQKNRKHLPGDEVIALRRTSDPLRHVRVAVDLQREKKIGDLLDAIDRLELPADAGRTKVGRALKEAGVKVRNGDLSLAIARRKAAGPPPVPHSKSGGQWGQVSANPLGQPGTGWGQPGDRFGRNVGTAPAGTCPRRIGDRLCPRSTPRIVPRLSGADGRRTLLVLRRCGGHAMTERPTCAKCDRPLYLIRPGRRLCAACSPVKAIYTPTKGAAS